jgi:hypothetical protein
MAPLKGRLKLMLEPIHIENLNPDVIVIKNLGSYNPENQNNYLKLYKQIDAHLGTP